MNETTASPLDELRSNWPQDDSGHRCLKLVVGFLNEKLIATAAGAQCTDRAQAESAADKLLANLIQQFRLVTVPVADKPSGPTLKPLHRFQPGENQEAKTEKK